MRGNLPHDVRKIHEKYGEIVRVAPDEVSFAAPDAWRDVFLPRSGRRPFDKDPVCYKPLPGQVPSVITAFDYTAHARMRGLLHGAFTEKALQDQELIIQFHVDLLISNLREKASSGIIVDMVDWFDYATFDIIGDLAFGEPFDCLRNSAYHPWVSMIFNSIRALTIAFAARYYPLVSIAFMKLIPKRVRENARDHHQLAVDKIHRRLNLEKKRHDFMTPIIENNADLQKMSLPEIESTFSILIVAGSETTATVLSGITNHLVQNPRVMQNLFSEIRGAFHDEKDMTIESLSHLPYLNAVISEGLRVCNPAPSGLPRLVPAGGEVVCGVWLPGNVSIPLAPSIQPVLLTQLLSYRRVSPSTPIQSSIHPSFFTSPNPSFRSAGYHSPLARQNMPLISFRLCFLLLSVLDDA